MGLFNKKKTSPLNNFDVPSGLGCTIDTTSINIYNIDEKVEEILEELRPQIKEGIMKQLKPEAKSISHTMDDLNIDDNVLNQFTKLIDEAKEQIEYHPTKHEMCEGCGHYENSTERCKSKDKKKAIKDNPLNDMLGAIGADMPDDFIELHNDSPYPCIYSTHMKNDKSFTKWIATHPNSKCIQSAIDCFDNFGLGDFSDIPTLAKIYEEGMADLKMTPSKKTEIDLNFDDE